MTRASKRDLPKNISLPQSSKKAKVVLDDEESRFSGDPFPADEARRRWPERYRLKVHCKNPFLETLFVVLFDAYVCFWFV